MLFDTFQYCSFFIPKNFFVVRKVYLHVLMDTEPVIHDMDAEPVIHDAHHVMRNFRCVGTDFERVHDDAKKSYDDALKIGKNAPKILSSTRWRFVSIMTDDSFLPRPDKDVVV